ncbi:hypothetical protein [Niabella ginsengisoli]|uniref:Uncharacterized protein n=1 Tax=Niabella ginsengisoli TaxID=522298 RepID=A0ABS9SL41_9BACT|nr:hypothetical protein [Niabella ginsengisoli]MCH5599094.1 hypothetical protein [Niabella ginsengisoli]
MSSSETETIMQKLDAAEFSILRSAIEKASTFASPTGKVSDILANPNGTVTFLRRIMRRF